MVIIGGWRGYIMDSWIYTIFKTFFGGKYEEKGYIDEEYYSGNKWEILEW